jgi:hypothetical protein
MKNKKSKAMKTKKRKSLKKILRKYGEDFKYLLFAGVPAGILCILLGKYLDFSKLF